MIKYKILLTILIVLLAFNLSAWGEKPSINIIYPHENQTIGPVDSNFIFGSVKPPNSIVIINGRGVPVHNEGGFIAFLPLKSGEFIYDIIAINQKDTAFIKYPITVLASRKSLGYDSLAIIKSIENRGNLILSSGDRLIVEFQGTPGCIAHFAIPGLADSIPMAETPIQPESYWGESVFGQGNGERLENLRGIYRGYFDIKGQMINDSTRICYFLSTPGFNHVFNYILSNKPSNINYEILRLLQPPRKSTLDSSNYFIRINPIGWPKMIEMTDSIQTIRVGPGEGYYSIFQPRGVTAQAVGKEGEWLKIKLSETQYGWINEKSIKYLPSGLPAVISSLKSIRSFSFIDKLIIEVPLSARHPFRVEEEDPNILLVDIFGVKSNTDWIRYDNNDSLLDLIVWKQVEPGQYRLRLKFNRPIWGYDVYYEGNTLKLHINKTPQGITGLKYKKIVVDPGHSPDPGAIGPTGLKESRANLDIALALKRELEFKGATVILTRKDMSDLPLNERPIIANANDADLFVSIHNNALPDGVNPFENNGVSTYYYHPHSISLARAVQKRMLSVAGLKDFGLYYGNLAVNRPTQYPAILVECAFIILPEQEALLKTATYRSQVAKAIRMGIEDFLREYDRE
jgi:N-acetylmuramoyl-L-alanine amidase